MLDNSSRFLNEQREQLPRTCSMLDFTRISCTGGGHGRFDGMSKTFGR